MTDDSRSMPGLFTRNRHLLVLTVVMILVAGASALVSLPRIEDPRITTRNATIVTPFPGAEARRLAEAAYGQPLSDVFADFEDAPIAAASIVASITAMREEGIVVRLRAKEVVEEDASP